MTVGDEPHIWQELRAQRDLLIELREKLAAVPDHEIRIRKLEERRYPLQSLAVWIAGGSLMVAIAATALVLLAQK